MSESKANLARTAPSLGDQVRSLQLPAETNSRPSFSIGLAWGLCVLLGTLCLALAWSAWGPRPQTATEDTPAAEVDASPQTAPSTAAAPAADSPVALESRGYIVPVQQILVSPEVSGRIIHLSVDEGARVTQGEVLAELDPTEYRLDLDRAEASVELARQRVLELERGLRPEEIAQAEAELRESEAQLEQMQSQFKRAGQLRRDSAIPVDQFELAESNYLAMQRRVERLRLALDLAKKGPRQERILAARAELKQFEAELAKAQWRLDKCTVKAPIDGTILRKNAEEGNLVNPIAFNGSFSIGEMADLSDLEVELDIQERDISRVFPGQPCRVRAEAYPDRVYQGTVSRLLPIADRAKGAIPVRVRLSVPPEEEGVYLKPEMAATVTFLSEAAGEAPPVADTTPPSAAQN